jgi:hypothetical protein
MRHYHSSVPTSTDLYAPWGSWCDALWQGDELNRVLQTSWLPVPESVWDNWAVINDAIVAWLDVDASLSNHVREGVSDLIHEWDAPLWLLLTSSMCIV